MRTLTYRMVEAVSEAVDREIKRLGEYTMGDNSEKIGVLEDFLKIVREEVPAIQFGTGKAEEKPVSVGPIYQVDQ